MRSFFSKNLSNFLSFLGLVGTIYFGVFYVPGRIEEAKREKTKNAQSELNQSIKELAFSDSMINLIEIQRLIEAKGLAINDNYPLSAENVITLAQESFMEDRFLPISTRKLLFQKLEKLKADIHEPQITEKEVRKGTRNTLTWMSWLSILAALITAVIGVYSIFLKVKEDKERQEELSNELLQTESIEPFTEYAYQFEKRIIEFLRDSGYVKDISESYGEPDNGIDFEGKIGDMKLYVYIKYYKKSKVGLKGIFPLLEAIRNKKGEAWLIYSSDLTSMVKNRIDDFNKSHEDIKIKTINAKTSEEFEQRVGELLPPNIVG